MRQGPGLRLQQSLPLPVTGDPCGREGSAPSWVHQKYLPFVQAESWRGTGEGVAEAADAEPHRNCLKAPPAVTTTLRWRGANQGHEVSL